MDLNGPTSDYSPIILADLIIAGEIYWGISY